MNKGETLEQARERAIHRSNRDSEPVYVVTSGGGYFAMTDLDLSIVDGDYEIVDKIVAVCDCE